MASPSLKLLSVLPEPVVALSSTVARLPAEPHPAADHYTKQTASTVTSADNTSAHRGELYCPIEKESRKKQSFQSVVPTIHCPLSTKFGTVYRCRTISSPPSKSVVSSQKHDSTYVLAISAMHDPHAIPQEGLHDPIGRPTELSLSVSLSHEHLPSGQLPGLPFESSRTRDPGN